MPSHHATTLMPSQTVEPLWPPKLHWDAILFLIAFGSVLLMRLGRWMRKRTLAITVSPHKMWPIMRKVPFKHWRN
jgi:hypothetical protein